MGRFHVLALMGDAMSNWCTHARIPAFHTLGCTPDVGLSYPAAASTFNLRKLASCFPRRLPRLTFPQQGTSVSGSPRLTIHSKSAMPPSVAGVTSTWIPCQPHVWGLHTDVPAELLVGQLHRGRDCLCQHQHRDFHIVRVQRAYYERGAQ